MAFLYKQVDRTKYEWLSATALLFEFTSGEHKGKLIEVKPQQVPQDLDNDNVIDLFVVTVEARRVNEKGETIMVGTSPIRANIGNHTIMQAAIAAGDINPVEYMAEKVADAIEKTMNIETTIGAFSFLPSMST